MTFANPLGLLALLAVPVVIAIHLYHRRFPPLPVAGLHLWTNLTQQPLAGRRRERLPISASLVLEILAAVLLSLVLAQPRFGRLDEVRHLVVVLDNTASMSARSTAGPTFRDLAVAELDRRFAPLPRGSVATLIVTGLRAEALAHALPWTEARQRLAQWQPSAVRHSFDAAWDTALQVAGPTGTVLFLTNRPLPEGRLPAALEIVSFGERRENVSIAAARWTYDSQKKQGLLFLRLQNHGAAAAAPRVQALKAGKPVLQKQVTLAPQSGTNFEAPLPGGLEELTIEVESPGDGLEIDSRANLIEPHPRMVTVADALPASHAARETLEKILAGLPEIQPGPPAEAHLLFAGATPLPESNSRTWWLGIGPISAGAKGIDLKGPYVLEKRNPLLEGVELAGVLWGGVQPSTVGTPLISSGSSRLLSRLNGTRTTGWLMNIDFSQSNLAESPDWPILVSNLVEARRNSLPGLQRWNYRLGEDVRFRLFEGTADSAKPLTLETTGSKRTLPRTADVELTALPRPGLYTIRDGDRVFDRFAVNFQDPEGSDLRGLKSFVQPARTQGASGAVVESQSSWAIVLLLLVLLAAVMADWRVLRV